jgi:hypothetical protein
MRLSLWIASLWPGFARAWVLGRWEGLALAAAFAAALNTGLMATLVWREELPGGISGTIATAAWVLVLGFWTVGIALVRTDRSRLRNCRAEADAEDDALLSEAQHEYLKGHWLEAEEIVARLLARRPNDAEARLLLASIQRRSGRWNEAGRTLVELRGEVSAVKWLQEIETELGQIEELKEEQRGAGSAECGMKAA